MFGLERAGLGDDRGVEAVDRGHEDLAAPALDRLAELGRQDRHLRHHVALLRRDPVLLERLRVAEGEVEVVRRLRARLLLAQLGLELLLDALDRPVEVDGLEGAADAPAACDLSTGSSSEERLTSSVRSPR